MLFLLLFLWAVVVAPFRVIVLVVLLLVYVFQPTLFSFWSLGCGGMVGDVVGVLFVVLVWFVLVGTCIFFRAECAIISCVLLFCAFCFVSRVWIQLLFFYEAVLVPMFSLILCFGAQLERVQSCV